MKTTQVSINEWMDNKCDIYTQRSIIQSQKEWNSAICDHTDESWRHYKWSKSGGERQILYDLTYMWNLEKIPSSYK